MNLDQLDAPFASEDIEWRIQQAGKNNNGIWAKVLAYVTNRAIMKRLDDVTSIAISRTMEGLSAVFPSKLMASGSPSGTQPKTRK